MYRYINPLSTMNILLKLKAFYLLGKLIHIPGNKVIKGYLYSVTKDGWGKVYPGGHVVHVSKIKKL